MTADAPESPTETKERRQAPMNLYAILRRNGWKTPDDLHVAAERSKKVGDTEMANEVRWIRSYVFPEQDGTLGTVCIYEATSPEAIRKHANRAELALSEIRPIADTVIVRPDPVK
jgi:hypothetical protein